MTKEKACDGCCYNSHPNEKFNCNKIVCNYLYQRKGKFYECRINEKGVEKL